MPAGRDQRQSEVEAVEVEAVEDDVICRIVRGELEAEVVFRDEQLIAFLDHHPVFKGHTLICPVRHATTLLDLPAETMEPVLTLARRVTEAQRVALGADGSFSAINTVGSQSVPHVHLHVVPRVQKDGLRGFFWPRTRYHDGEAADYGARLRSVLHDTT